MHLFEKPCLAIDYDGVIVDTNTIKAIWIAENLEIEIRPGSCDHTRCIPYIGAEAYSRMSSLVYGKEYSLLAQPLLGVESAVSSLSKNFCLIIVSARNELQIGFVSEWLKLRNMAEFFEDIISCDLKTKLHIANELSALAILDDDVRHLQYPDYTNIAKVHFDIDLSNDIEYESNLIHVKGWNPFVEYINKIVMRGNNNQNA